MKQFLFVLGLLSGFSSFAGDKSLQIKVLQIQGSATEEVGKATFPLKVGSVIRQGAKVKVAAESMVILSMGKDVVTKLAANSDAVISNINKKDWELNLLKGITASAVRNPEKRPNHFQVRNRTVTLGVRGTVFYTENIDHQPAFLCTCKGTVAVINAKGKQIDSITATHHDRPIELETLKTAPMGSGHSDADVAFLEGELNKL